MSAKITFPVVGKQYGETIRRNAETGVEIRSSKLDRGGMEHSVYVPDAEHGYRLADYFGELASARDEATSQAEQVRDNIFIAHNAAIAENAKRRPLATLDEQLRGAEPSLAVDTDPEVAAEVAEANGLDAEDAAVIIAEAIAVKPIEYVVIGYRDEVVFAADAADAPKDALHAGMTWKISADDEIHVAPGGRQYVIVDRSWNDAIKGLCTAAAAAWLDELRTPEGKRVTFPGLPRTYAL